MWLAFALCPLLIVAPAVVIGGLMVLTLLSAPVIVLGGICLVMFGGSRRARSARKRRQLQKANRQPPRAHAELDVAVGATVPDGGRDLRLRPDPAPTSTERASAALVRDLSAPPRSRFRPGIVNGVTSLALLSCACDLLLRSTRAQIGARRDARLRPPAA
jgi:hypothetical protein